ncbi:MAG: alpha/beta fold hydrolase [Spirochaetaceae bacterium]|nr:alpha/beta fold hydrolase [Spirochaetaceae bacterium]
MTAIIIVGVIILLITGGALMAGAIMFKELFVRKPDDGSTNPTVIQQALEKMRQNTPGRQVDGVKTNDKFAVLSAHVKDPKIMIPVLEAKLRWLSLLEKGEIQELSVTAYDEITLAGYLWETAGSKGVALLVHGYTDSAAGMAYLAEEYHRLGFSVLSVDCRAHGKSGGKNITMGYTDAKDLARWIERIQELKGSQTNLILHGVSMGAVTVIQALNEKTALESADTIRGVAADCGFSSALDQLSQQGTVIFGSSPLIRLATKLMLADLSAVNYLRCGFLYSQDSARNALIRRRELATQKVPLVLFHGENDAFISPDMAHQLEEAAGSEKVLKIHVPGAPHIGSYFYDKAGYMEGVRKAFGI